MKLKFVFWAAIACSSCAVSTASEREPAFALMKFRPLYGMCGVQQRSPQPETDIRAAASFEQSLSEHQAGRYDAAALGFFQSARQWLDFPYNRRVAYANGVNAWLSAEHVEQARAALLDAARMDPEFAAELTAWANALPQPARCQLEPARKP
jgi:hypothetical protein